jgi:hypothetical protein
MHELKEICAFGLPYFRPYMSRFVAGVVLGMIFRLSNGLLAEMAPQQGISSK